MSFKNSGGINTKSNLGNLEISIGEIEKDFVEKLYKTVEQKLREELERVGIEVKDKIFRFEKKRLNFKTFQILVTVPEPDQAIEKGIISATGTAIFKCEYNGKLTTLEIAIETVIGSDKSQILNMGEFLSLFAASLKCGICSKEIKSKYRQEKYRHRWELAPKDSRNKRLKTFSSLPSDRVIRDVTDEILTARPREIIRTVKELEKYNKEVSELTKRVENAYDSLRNFIKEKLYNNILDLKFFICPVCQELLISKPVKTFAELSNISTFQDIQTIEFFEYLGKIPINIEFKEA